MTKLFVIVLSVLLLAGCANKDVYLMETYNGTATITASGDSSHIFSIAKNDSVHLVTSRLSSVDGYHELKRRGFFTFFIELANVGSHSQLFVPEENLTVSLLDLRTDKLVQLPYETGKFALRTFAQRLGNEHTFTKGYASELSELYATTAGKDKPSQKFKTAWLKGETNELGPNESVIGFVLVKIDDVDQLEGRSRLGINVAGENGVVSTHYLLVCRQYRGLESRKC